MHDDPLRIIAAQSGVFLYREALAAGYTKNMVTSMRRSGAWHRVRHGAYCFADTWKTLSDQERHLLLARAVRRTTAGPIAFSHATALLIHGVAVWDADLTRVHATRLDHGPHRTECDVVHHVGAWTGADISVVDGLPVMTAARAVVEHATQVTLESSLVSANDALYRDLATPPELHRLKERFMHWPGSQRFHLTLHHMDGRAASAGESRANFLFWRQGIPMPELQWPVFDERGRLIAIIDFAWPDFGVFGEFDGRLKYLRPFREGDDASAVVVREKAREDLVRRLTGWPFVRLVWSDLHHPARTAAYVREMLYAG